MSGVIDQDLNPAEGFLGSAQQARDVSWVGQVRFPGFTPAAERADRPDDLAGVPGESPKVVPRPGLIMFFVFFRIRFPFFLWDEPQICQKNVCPFAGEGDGRSGSDAVIRARYQSDFALESRIDHIFPP